MCTQLQSHMLKSSQKQDNYHMTPLHTNSANHFQSIFALLQGT